MHLYYLYFNTYVIIKLSPILSYPIPLKSPRVGVIEGVTEDVGVIVGVIVQVGVTPGVPV